MDVRATTDAARDAGADTVAVGVFAGEGVAHDLSGGELQALVDSGEAARKLRRVAVAHGGGLRWLVVGLGPREEFDAERARVAAASAVSRARELGCRSLAWEVPHHVDDAVVAGLVEGTVLADYRFDEYKSDPGEDARGIAELVVSAHHDVSGPAEAAAVAAAAANRGRDLQNRPANDMTPTRLAEHARGLGLDCEVLGREQIRAAGMGAFSAVAQGSQEEPALITVRYEGAGARGPLLALVGKAVTFDSGGISLKPGKGMGDMKFDMSGGAAVLQALDAIARLELPLRVLAVVGATENLPSGNAVKPGDIVRAKKGTTIEVLNTDAEGRLVLADCITHALDCGAERIVDIATLTGGIVTTFGNVHAGLMANDDEWAARIEAAGERSGELVWRLPLHPDYAKMLEGRYADLQNVNEDRRATSIGGGEFLHHFAGDEVPWAHVDIAGVGWNRGRDYVRNGGSGFGVRLLVELARGLAAG